MKYCSMYILTFVSSLNLFSQIHFPLGVGDVWHYQSYIPADDGSLIVYIIDKDSIVQGKKYSSFHGLKSPVGPKLLRQEGNKVFGYNQIDSNEYIILDFTANSGDTISIHTKKSKKIVALGNLKFKEIDSSNKHIPEETWTIKDSVGVVFIYNDPGHFTVLTGAKINGKYITSVVDRNGYLYPSTPILHQNYPNPFNSSTTIKYSLTNDAKVSLKLFDILGRELFPIFEGHSSAGTNHHKVHLFNLSSGVYFYQLQSDKYSETKKMFFLK